MTRHKLTGKEFTIQFSDDLVFKDDRETPYYYFIMTSLDGQEQIEGWSVESYADAFDNVLGNAL